MLYLVKNNLDLDPNSFDFSVRGRANTPVKRSSNMQSQARPKRSKKEPSKLMTISVPKPVKTKKKSKVSKGQANDAANTQPQTSSSGPKLIVKFNFPIARLKRTPSMKTKKANKKKVVRQESQTSQISETHDSQTSDNSHTSAAILPFECHEELSNGEARLTNGLDFDDVSELV